MFLPTLPAAAAVAAGTFVGVGTDLRLSILASPQSNILCTAAYRSSSTRVIGVLPVAVVVAGNRICGGIGRGGNGFGC